jgi:hypothetical protein
MAIADTRDISIVGPVNGMNEPDPAGSYLRLVLTKGEIHEERRISLGAADVLKAELTAVLAPALTTSEA